MRTTTRQPKLFEVAFNYRTELSLCQPDEGTPANALCGFRQSSVRRASSNPGKAITTH
jgi:hypothetical protein